MSSDLSRTQSGFSLLYVLITISALSALLIHHAYMKTVREDRRAFEYSVAQLQNVLNLANAYYLENGHWPKDNNDVCSTPDTEISNMVTLTNGWGNDIVGNGDCSDGDSTYEIYQIIPDKYYNRFASLLNEDVSRDYSGTPSGFSRLFVRIDRQAVTGGRFVDVKKLPETTPSVLDWDPAPIYYTPQSCPVGTTERYLIGMDGMCADAKKNPLHFPSPEDPVYSGFRVKIFWWWGYRALGYDGLVENDGSYYDGVFPDKYHYASYHCPANWNNSKSDINVLYIEWCE